MAKVKSVFICVLLLNLCSVFAFTDSNESSSITRGALWDTERIKKSSSLKPEKISKIEKFLLNSDKEGGFGLNWKGIYPKFGGIETGAGPSFGIRYWRRELFGTPLELQTHALYSLKKYQLYSIQFGKIMKSDLNRLMGTRGFGGLHNFFGLDKKDYDFFLFGTYKYRILTQEDFYGLGPDTTEENRTDFRQEDSTLTGIAGYRLNSWTILAGGVGHMKVDIDKGEDNLFPDTQTVFTDVSAPGLAGGSRFIFGGANFVVDLRDRPWNPHSGFMLGLEYLWYHDTTETNFNFSRTSFDARGYLPLGAEHRILALQLYTSLNHHDSDSRVPFYLMETLGGPEALRGFNNYRFRDDNLISLSAEYRWEPAPFWELALFYDSGKVFPDGVNWSLKDLERGYGIGMRIKIRRTVLFRFDVGHSTEGTKFYFRYTSPSF